MANKMTETQAQEEFLLNKIIIFNSKEREYPEVKGNLKIKDSFMIALEIQVITANYYASASNTRENEVMDVYIVPGSKIKVFHEYKFIHPSFNDDHKNTDFKQEFEVNMDIEGPEWFEDKWLYPCSNKDWEKNSEKCEEKIKFLENLVQNKLDIETFKVMLKDLLENLTPTINQEDEELFDNGNKFVANVIQFIKDKMIDKINNVNVDNIN